jgi:ribosomal protein S18 acetylase RimI-like enzyme
MNVRTFTIDDYDAVRALWGRTPGVCVREADSREGIGRYLSRNPDFSYIAEHNDNIVGCAMCGHDGRRGYLQHVAIDTAYRGRGIAQQLISRCLAALEREGILKVHLDVLVTNLDAQAYWKRRGWKERHDITRYSIILSSNQNA